VALSTIDSTPHPEAWLPECHGPACSWFQDPHHILEGQSHHINARLCPPFLPMMSFRQAIVTTIVPVIKSILDIVIIDLVLLVHL